MTMLSPQISVLMPTWNAGQFIGEAINSILAQTFADFEIIVVDGGSTDQTREILAAFRDPRLRVLTAPSPGIVPALNFGIEQARAPWIARHDADDISMPDRFETQWKALQGQGKAVFCHSDVEFVGEGRLTMGHARF